MTVKTMREIAAVKNNNSKKFKKLFSDAEKAKTLTGHIKFSPNNKGSERQYIDAYSKYATTMPNDSIL